MELQLLLPNESPKQAVISLKNFIEKASIPGLQSVEVDRTEHQQGQLGAGNILNSVSTIIEAATSPLVELVKCLQKFVDNYRTVIKIPTKNGPIEINHGRSMTPEELRELIISIQQNDE